MKNTFLIFIFFLATCTALPAQNYKDKYKDLLQTGDQMLWANYQHVGAKTPDGRYVRMTFHPEKEVMTHRATFTSKKMKVKTGPYQEWYDNGYPWMEGRYENGIQEGEWRYYTFDQGTLREKGSYSQGLKEGKWVSFDTLGRVILEEHYKAGRLHGDWKRFNKEGELINTRVYQSGQMVFEEFTKNSSPSDTLGLSETMPFLKGCENEDTKAQKTCSEQKMLESIYRQIKYPLHARLNDVQGTAVIRFVIEKDGSISGITTMRGICEEIEKECIRVVGLMPAWNPGLQRGKPVRVQFSLPIKFKLE